MAETPYRTPEPKAVKPSKIIQLAANRHRVYALDEDGRVWTLDSGDNREKKDWIRVDAE